MAPDAGLDLFDETKALSSRTAQERAVKDDGRYLELQARNAALQAWVKEHCR